MYSRRRLLCGSILMMFMLLVTGIAGITVQAKSKDIYFISGDMFYHVVKGSKVEVCGTKKTEGTLTVPAKVVYKGKSYTVTGIAAHERVNKDVSIDSENADGSSVDLNLPGTYYYGYYRKDDKAIPDGVDWIPGSAVSKVVLPSSLTYIGEGAFCGCDSLKTVVFAKKYNKLTIGDNAFCGKALKSIAFPAGTVKLGENAAGTTKNITIPASVTGIGAGVVNYKTQKVTISKKNKKYKMKNGILYSKNEKTLVGISGKAGKSITISSKTVTIAEHAFAGSKVTAVILNDKITEIPKGAFADCSKLVSVSGTESITSIDYAAFKGCGKLEGIGNTEKLSEIKRAAFWGDNNLTIKISSAIDIDENALSGTLYDTTVKLTVPENDPVYSVREGLIIKTKGSDSTVIMQTGAEERIVVPEGITSIAVKLGGSSCKEVKLPSTLKLQKSRVTVNDGTVTYQSIAVPKLGREFDIANAGKGKVTVYVPKDSLEAYRKAMDKAVDARIGIPLFDDETVIAGQ